MRGLKFAAIASFSLLLVMLLMVGYLFMTAEVQVTDIRAQGTGITAEELAEIKTSIEENTFVGTLYQKPLEWKDASEYIYLDYSVKLLNNCLVPIDMIEAQIVPQSNDILQAGDLNVHSLDMKTEGDLKVRILTTKDTHPIREIIVTYYVWGVSFSLKTVYGG
ncbi:MAG: hypothetical protein J6K55_03020 [Clostridia bacterium]|nr:hypothetical protein [Clostridia bacterium]